MYYTDIKDIKKKKMVVGVELFPIFGGNLGVTDSVFSF